MQPRISKTLFSNLLSKFAHLPKSPVTENSPSLASVAHFSTNPGRPMRGDSMRHGNESEENFLRNLNFEGKRDRDDAEKPRQNPRSRHPDQPLSGDRRERRVRDGQFNRHSYAGSKDFRGFPETNGERNDGSFKTGDGEKEKDKLGDALLKNLNFGATDSPKTAEETNTATSVPEEADVIFKKMKETGLIPNAVAMLDGLCKDGLVQEAMKLFGLMRERGTIPEVVIYTAVVEGFCKAAKFDDAKRIFRKMQKNGIVPNAFSYGVMIQGLIKGKRLEDAVEFCVEMLESGHSPNPATLTGLVDGFCKEKGVEEAEGFVRSLREKGFAIDEMGVREYLDKKGPYSPMVWEAIFGKKKSQRPF
ncbi:uncharacterized protein A4U43_C05F15780 [Asparagus officinalis]|uniref:Pentacotripeptide-repeat region of PRORP domain-containing protein n=1 Tax=Asparagus officinalis TaxID=4686 RepID=A0A5P1ES41_ASPOF|nr:pentatricopeptide repeat-containing protein At4g38150 [Asparagus officinalis]ONK68766.1 uncharacterized protein A4U43_C05F15780 [Asparagus officinalis]